MNAYFSLKTLTIVSLVSLLIGGLVSHFYITPKDKPTEVRIEYVDRVVVKEVEKVIQQGRRVVKQTEKRTDGTIIERRIVTAPSVITEQKRSRLEEQATKYSLIQPTHKASYSLGIALLYPSLSKLTTYPEGVALDISRRLGQSPLSFVLSVQSSLSPFNPRFGVGIRWEF